MGTVVEQQILLKINEFHIPFSGSWAMECEPRRFSTKFDVQPPTPHYRPHFGLSDTREMQSPVVAAPNGKQRSGVGREPPHRIICFFFFGIKSDRVKLPFQSGQNDSVRFRSCMILLSLAVGTKRAPSVGMRRDPDKKHKLFQKGVLGDRSGFLWLHFAPSEAVSEFWYCCNGFDRIRNISSMLKMHTISQPDSRQIEQPHQKRGKDVVTKRLSKEASQICKV